MGRPGHAGPGLRFRRIWCRGNHAVTGQDDVVLVNHNGPRCPYLLQGVDDHRQIAWSVCAAVLGIGRDIR